MTSHFCEDCLSASLEADGRRLDWLDGHSDIIGYAGTMRFVATNRDGRPVYDTLRAAIDAAMQAKD